MKKEEVKVCPEGYVVEDGRCVEENPEMTTMSDPKTCPPGYILVNKRCVEDLTPGNP